MRSNAKRCSNIIVIKFERNPRSWIQSQFSQIQRLLEGKMDVIAQLIDDALGSRRLALHFHPLRIQVFDSVINGIQLLAIFFLFLASIKPDDCLQNLLPCKSESFFLYLFLQRCDMIFDMTVVFLHRVVVGDDGFVDFLLEIGKKPLDDGDHFDFSFCDLFPEVLLLPGSENLLIFDVQATVGELFNSLLKESAEVCYNFMHTGIDLVILFELAICLLRSMLLGMYLDAGGTKREEAVCVFAEIEDELLGVERATFRFVDYFRHIEIVLFQIYKLVKLINQPTLRNNYIFLFNSRKALSIESFVFAPVNTTFPDAKISADFTNSSCLNTTPGKLSFRITFLSSQSLPISIFQPKSALATMLVM